MCVPTVFGLMTRVAAISLALALGEQLEDLALARAQRRLDVLFVAVAVAVPVRLGCERT